MVENEKYGANQASLDADDRPSNVHLSTERRTDIYKSLEKLVGTYRVIERIPMTGSKISNHFRCFLLNSSQFFFQTIHMI